MKWFEHRHYWRPMTRLNTVVNKEGKTTACLIIEDCVCGAVRTIEYGSGQDPIVRYAKTERKDG